MLYYTCVMDWDGEVEYEPEIGEWWATLSATEQVRVERYVSLLARRGPLLDEPHSRQLRGKLRELRFSLPSGDWRITYYLATGKRAILLTAFSKTKDRETAQVERAWRAMERCLREGHTAEDDE